MTDQQLLDQLNEAIDQLRHSYEKYFAGIERIEPQRDRQKVKRMINQLRSQRFNNTASRFRFQSLQARLVTFESHWNRICRQIEEGTFKRDLIRAQRRQKQFEQKKERPKAPDSSLTRLHQEFETACKKLGENKGISLDALQKTVEKQSAAIKSKYGCKDVHFSVDVKNGKVVLKAKAKK